MIFAVLGEDRSDAETLATLVRRIRPNVGVKKKGFNSCAELVRKGARVLVALASDGVDRFVVCHDADGPDPTIKRDLVEKQVVQRSGLEIPICIVIPVQEIEAWIIADELAIQKVILGFSLSPVLHPETIQSPKEWLERESRGNNSKPRYSHATHNPRVAEHLDLNKVAGKCPSFKAFRDCLLH